MTYPKSQPLLRNVFFAFATACLLASCQDKELIPSPEETSREASPIDEEGNVETNIPSLTISGEHTVFTERIVCHTCTYVVAKNTEVVDGKELGLKPGSIICLDKTLNYGNLTFINLEGTADNPITIGNCIQ